MSGRDAPGWYRDPHDPGRLRRWNGRNWTRQTRPVPDWLRTVRAEPAPGPPGRSRARGFWLLSIACLVAAFVVLVLRGGSGETVESIGDRDFAQAADRRCEEAAAEIRSLPRSSDDAERIGRMIAEWRLMVADLEGLDVAPADRSAVAAWLRDWRRWLDAGAEYVEALDEADRRTADFISNRSQPAKQRIDRFALANGMPSCVI